MSPAKKRGSINLTALGSAAVLAVYAAGYLRTRPAAQRFERNDSERRPVPPVVVAPIVVDTLMDLVQADTLRPVVTASAPPKQAKKVVTADSAPAKRDSEPTKIPKDSAPVIAAATPAPVPIDSVKVPTDSAKVALKDGTYTGWGTSRHGDIQAAVEIKAGRIVSAYITQCLTRYSCSRIAAIIPQVVQRQSPEVDYVSGATQSTDAFYYAVVEALSKAK
jgi:uncharacterized protein with FMN-binding domain